MTGTPCEHCGQGYLIVYATKRGGRRETAVRYFRCWLCGWKPPKPAGGSKGVTGPVRAKRLRKVLDHVLPIVTDSATERTLKP